MKSIFRNRKILPLSTRWSMASKAGMAFAWAGRASMVSPEARATLGNWSAAVRFKSLMNAWPAGFRQVDRNDATGSWFS